MPPLYQIPDDQSVLEAIHNVLKRERANSQNELASKVINRMPANYALSAHRARRIASKSKRIRIRMLTRRAARAMANCPFCGKALEKMNIRDIFGNMTTGGRACPDCGFRIDPGRRGPARYIFELR